MTGKYPAGVGITDFTLGHRRPWEKLLVPTIKNRMVLSEVTAQQRRHFGIRLIQKNPYTLDSPSIDGMNFTPRLNH